MSLLEIESLRVEYETPHGVVRAVDDVSLELDETQTLGLVGESGSGKTQIALAIMGLLPAGAHCAGTIRYRGETLTGMDERRMRRLRGTEIALVFQDPQGALNPYLTIGRQLTEVLRVRTGLARRQARARAIELLDAVHIPDPEERLASFPHQLSGGMQQRAVIAIALAGPPSLLIADEPTTALDVTVQAQILTLLREIQRRFRTAVLAVSHDLGVIARLAHQVLVMYAGRAVEHGPVRDVLKRPRHPYTQSLIEAVPRLDGGRVQRLQAIPGTPPAATAIPPGCPFHPRCAHRFDPCDRARPVMERGEHRAACHLLERS